MAATRIEIRYGCFLPDLTGLATDSSATSLSLGNIVGREAKGKCFPTLQTQEVLTGGRKAAD